MRLPARVCAQVTATEVNWRTNTWSSHNEWFPWWSVCICCHLLLGNQLLFEETFDGLICVEVAVDLTGPLLLAKLRIQFGFPPAQPTGTDMKVLRRMFYSVRGPRSISVSLSLPSISLSHKPQRGFLPLIQKFTAVSPCWTEPHL